jgi:predicted transcriptional regulator
MAMKWSLVFDIPSRSGYSVDMKAGGRAMATVMEKEEAHRLIDRMPPEATGDDLMRELYVREAIGCGLADSNAGRARDVKEVRAKYRCRVHSNEDK